MYNRILILLFSQTATEPVRKAIYETKVAPRGSKPRFMSMEEGVKKMQKVKSLTPNDAFKAVIHRKILTSKQMNFKRCLFKKESKTTVKVKLTYFFQGLFAFHMEIGVGYKFVGKYFQESEKCGLKEIQYLQVIDPWLAVRKNTPFKEMFKIG